MTGAPRQVARFRVGRRADFKINTFCIRELAGKSVGVVHTRYGFYAVLNRCPHQGAPICMGRITGTNLPGRPFQLSYGLKDRLVKCPWHGFEFELASGRHVLGITKKRLVTYPVVIVGDEIFVEMGSHHEQPPLAGSQP